MWSWEVLVHMSAYPPWAAHIPRQEESSVSGAERGQLWSPHPPWAVPIPVGGLECIQRWEGLVHASAYSAQAIPIPHVGGLGCFRHWERATLSTHTHHGPFLSPTWEDPSVPELGGVTLESQHLPQAIPIIHT